MSILQTTAASALYEKAEEVYESPLLLLLFVLFFSSEGREKVRLTNSMSTMSYTTLYADLNRFNSMQL